MIAIGDNFKHIYSPQYTCTILDTTSKGYKVAQTETFPNPRKKPKTTTQYYNYNDFNTDKAIWEPLIS